MTPSLKTVSGLGLATLSLAILSGCTTAKPHLSADFGYAVRQAVVSQIADPDATYNTAAAPGSNGARVQLAQERYRTGRVITPSATASTIGLQNTAVAP
ncbi:MAG: hypothetical protein RLZZ141_168 [Pseudomonadota bacterium]|jgi:uncharacterized protein YceK